MAIDGLPLPQLEALLAEHRVWGQLDATSRMEVARKFSVETVAANTRLVDQGKLDTRLGMVIQGELLLQDPDLDYSVRIFAGEVFGLGVTPSDQLACWQVSARTEALIAWLSADTLQGICRAHPAMRYFLPSLPLSDVSAAGRNTSKTGGSESGLLGTPIRHLIKRSPVALPIDVSIKAAAETMRDKGVSCLLLMDKGHLAGIITDRDLRNRVLAKDLSPSRPVADIATREPMTVNANSPAFEALLLMARHNIHHVPVTDGAETMGVVSTSDLTEQQTNSAVYLASDIHRQSSLEGLVRISTQIKQLQQSLAAADVSAYSTAHIITALTDAFTVRLIQLAESELGPAPVAYVWAAAGSQARNEQTAKSDQDNCLILDDRYDEAVHGEYFRNFTKAVCDGLDACGYIHCPGEMMAMTDTWRQPKKRWTQYFHKWVDQPEPKALMLTCVFFDLRAIHGDAELLADLRRDVLQSTKSNSLFLAHMVGNALKHRPPLSMFGNIALIRDEEHQGTIDLKHTAIVPIVDLARVYALADGIDAVNTSDRLAVAAQRGEISKESARDLSEALEFMSRLRIDHQARQIRADKLPDNFLALEELSNFERSHLKTAFHVIQTLQSVLGQRYQSGRF